MKTHPEQQRLLPRIDELLRSAQAQLEASSRSARLDAEVLLSHCLNKPRSFLMTWPEHRPQADQSDRFAALLRRRVNGEPIAYLLGEREFWSLPLRVTPATLIPRPETEQLVEQALTHIPPEQGLEIADLGTGSGAIAIAIAHERPCCRITAIEHSVDAIAVARDNARRLGLENISFRQGDWFAGDSSHYDIIIANPPYVRSADPHLLEDGLPFEPATALVGGADGLDAIRVITQQAREHLNAGGWLLCEHGYEQQPAVIELLRQYGYINIKGLPDLDGTDRLVEGQWKTKS